MIEIAEDEDDENKKEKLVFVQYRGKVSVQFEQSLRRFNAPCKVIYTIRKLKTALPSLKNLSKSYYKAE